MKFFKQPLEKTIKTGLIISVLVTPFTVQAKDVTVQVTNLTNGIYFTPLLVAAHNKHVDFYELGQPASEALQAMAEGGDFSGLSADAAEQNADISENPVSGLLAPGHTATVKLANVKRSNNYVSVTAMLLPTNDGFVGADSIKIPNIEGTYTYYLNGYDAGTEANDEVINGAGLPNNPGIPADPGGNSGIGATGLTTVEHNQKVHVHRGIVGDQYVEGGNSDLDPVVHRWLNPVAKLVITVNCNNNRHSGNDFGKYCR